MRETVELEDGKVTLVGTAHVSEESRKEVEKTIGETEPDLVAVELDQQRYESLVNQEGWKELDVAEAIKDGKGSLLLVNLLLSVYQRQIGMEKGIKPGQEMLSAVETAENNGIDCELLDRDINETFERVREELSLWEKYKLLASFAFGFWNEEEQDVEELKQKNVLDQLVEELEDEFPSISRVFLDERNSYMSEKLLEKEFEHAVVVVGAAHLDGIKKILEEGSTELKQPSESRVPWMRIAKYGLPAFIIAGLGFSFYKIGFSAGVKASSFWILSNGILAMLGAVIARSHPLTWASSFVAAPLTSLDPAVGAGMVAAYVEGRFYPPTVEELESIAYTDSYRELWHNQVGRILLTFFFVTIGSASATFLSAGYIASLLAGL